MTKKKAYLDQAYELDSADKTRAFYSKWAETYDEELRANAYASPARVAGAMAAAVSDRTAPLLDLGCGTGLSGEALSQAGFTTLDGTDFSREMLAIAKGKSIYRSIVESDADRPVPAAKGDYQNFTAVGVFSPGHAPPDLIATVVELLPAGGCFGFTLNDHALEEPAYLATIERLVGAGTIAVAFEERGDHLPRIGLQAVVYVLRRR